MKNESEIPELFSSARDYKIDVSAVEDGHETANEIALYHQITEAAQQIASESNHSLVICDLCSASGGCAEQVLSVVGCDSLFLVDIEPAMIEGAKQKKWACEKVYFELADAVTWTSLEKIDIILMNSSYHHIENTRKSAFLSNAASLLNDSGSILVGEHFLPPYDVKSEQSFKQAVLRFYKERIGFLEKLNTPKQQLDVIRQTGLYCWNQEYEYQVSFDVFAAHVHEAGLEIVNFYRVWPEEADCLPEKTGSYFCQLKRKTMPKGE